MQTRPKAIVIGCHVSGLGVIRALGIKGVDVVALAYDATECGSVSRYVSETHVIPHPRKEAERFVEFLNQKADVWRGALFDTDDDGAVTLSQHKRDLSEDYLTITPDWDVLRTFIEKDRTWRLAKLRDVPHPTTAVVSTEDELRQQKAQIQYPCILKPVRGHEFKDVFGKKSFRVGEYEELTTRFRQCRAHGQDVMVQEIIPGPDSNIEKCMLYIDVDGTVSASFFL